MIAPRLDVNNECDICLAHTAISSLHAFIEASFEQFRLYDNVSTNGTFINEKKIRFDVLHAGDEIRFGRNRYRFEIEFESG